MDPGKVTDNLLKTILDAVKNFCDSGLIDTKRSLEEADSNPMGGLEGFKTLWRKALLTWQKQQEN